MSPADIPLSRERILETAEAMIRRHGPTKATVVDVARALGVSHTAVYRHVATKAELRDLVVQRWVEETMPQLRALAAKSKPSAPKRLRGFYDALIAVKRRRAASDPEVFAAYRALSVDAASVSAAHVAELVELTAAIIASGVVEGSFRRVDPAEAARAVLWATARFHHPAHFREWDDPALEAIFDDVWRMLMSGLATAKKDR